MKTIAVLAVQGAFAEHAACLSRLGVQVIELRQLADLSQPFDGLVLPGGESTVQGKLLQEQGMLEPLREKIRAGMPVLATCAGLILLASSLSNDDHVYFGTLPVTVRRNGYGRQLGSFHTVDRFGPLEAVPMTFIRAPYIETPAPEVEILSQTDGRITGVRYGRQIGISFHPELTEDLSIHRYFLSLVE